MASATIASLLWAIPTAALLIVLATSSAQAVEKNLVDKGEVLSRENCSRCHAIGKEGESPHKDAPPSERCLENTRSQISLNHWPRASFPVIPICQSSCSIHMTSRRSSTISNRFRTDPRYRASSRKSSRSSFEWSAMMALYWPHSPVWLTVKRKQVWRHSLCP